MSQERAGTVDAEALSPRKRKAEQSAHESPPTRRRQAAVHGAPAPALSALPLRTNPRGHALRVAQVSFGGLLLFCARCGGYARSRARSLLGQCSGTPTTSGAKAQLKRLAHGKLPFALGAGAMGPAFPPPPEVLSSLLGAHARPAQFPREPGPGHTRTSFWAPSALVRSQAPDRAQLLFAYGLTEEDLSHLAARAASQASSRRSGPPAHAALDGWDHWEHDPDEAASDSASEESGGH